MKSEIYFSEKTFEQLTKAIVAAAEIIAAKKCESCDTPRWAGPPHKSRCSAIYGSGGSTLEQLAEVAGEDQW
jgi:hypothetical protein